LAIAAVIAAAGLGLAAPAASALPGKSSPAAPAAPNVQAMCGAAPKGKARCFALRRVDVAPHLGATPFTTPAGYGPGDLASAYALPANGGAGQTVAIVDAFDDPNAEADLAVYRSQFGLPACTTANGCFQKVDQRGGTSYPPTDTGWAGEISLDIDMVSAVAPHAHILLVEADDNSFNNLGAAVDEAVALGAKYVSNSYGSGYSSTPGSGEDPSEAATLDPFYNHPGVAMVASSGDSAFGVSYPAASQYVASVGGTSLIRDGSARGWSESVWNNSFGGPGSGCSLYEAKPPWQADSGCSNRTVADVSAVADPATGVAVYDTFGSSGWAVFGGTSASSPIIASVFADASTPVAGTYPSSYPYADPGGLNDVTTGNNGSCSPAYLCTAKTGYDGPTGLGTPNGVSAFVGGPRGTISGSVTDSSTLAGISGASVSAGDATTFTDASGHYSMSVPVGTYTLTAGAFGYGTASINNVVVADGGTNTVNVALVAVPKVTVSGNVTDGSGHNWPLYATLTVDGVPGGTVYTNPVTGHYSIQLPSNATYQVHVTANYPGYSTASQPVVVGSSDTTANFQLTVDAAACDAPGYAVQTTGSTETFDGTSVPAGWTVINNTAVGGWEFDDPHPRGNLTGGTGGFAIIDSDYLGIGNHEDTYLVSPVANLTGVNSPDVSFDSDYRNLVSVAQVDYSIDGGATWTNVWDHSGSDARGPSHIDIPLPSAANQANVQVRFHYTATWAWWWEVDNVMLGTRTCVPVAGGLVVGNVTDFITGAGLNGATVTSDDHPADNATTAATPDDPNLGDGFYWMFSSLTGAHGLTGAQPGYVSKTMSANIAADGTTKVDFALKLPDNTAPTDAPVVTGTLGSGGWYTSDVSVAWNWTDEAGGSGIDTANCTQSSGSGSAQGSAVVVSSSCQDLAGNPASDSKTFKIDKAGPTIVCAVAAPGPVFQLGAANQHVSATASDATSGLVGSASLTTAASTSSPGAKTAAFSASDNAGNTTNTTCPYVVGYRFGGFTSPLPKTTVKSGSSLPLKFMLQNAAGQPISDSEAQSLVSPSCKITIIVVKGGPVSGCPTYSSSAKQFQFNLKITDAMKGANGVSITVTIGGAVVTASAVDPFTVK
jgi:hypothetical protein